MLKEASPAQAEVLAAPNEPATAGRSFYLGAAAVFLSAAFLTVYWAGQMRGGMPMPGGWQMSMMWMMGRGAEGALLFTATWLAMMVAMMLPSTLPMLQLYARLAKFQQHPHLATATASVAAGYFFIWSLFGLMAWLGGESIVWFAMHSSQFSRAIPFATSAALVIAGAYQLTPAKSACLRHCRDPLLLLAQHGHNQKGGALRLGIHHGAFCAACCWGLMLMQLSLGVMNLWLMAAVATVIAAEKLTQRGPAIAKLVGAAAITLGALLAIHSIFNL